MTIRILRFLPLALLAFPKLLPAASTSVEAEYQQVRTIAMRDAKVSAAFAEAERRLDAKIVQIDPAMAAYVEARKHAKPVAVVSRKPAARPAGSAVHGVTHVVAAGETLGGIAAKYGVSVAALKAANQISDERKLRVGQSLRVLGAKPKPASKKEAGFWDSFKRRL